MNLKKIKITLTAIYVAFTGALLAIIFGSETIRFHIHQNIIANRIGKPEIAFLGDSITKGGFNWGHRLGLLTYNIWNYGHGGFTTYQIVNYAKKVANRGETKIAFVMAGINDFDKSALGASKSYEDYRSLIKHLQHANINIVITLLVHTEKDETKFFVNTLNECIRAYCMSENIPYIDLNPVLAPNDTLLPEYSKDGVHLTDEAYDVWASEIKDLVKADPEYFDGTVLSRINWFNNVDS